eukprot:NODE_568_length_1347_cov_192.484592_g443_i0.p1 GENE.NODE_568_length_1347_cov_192.484592_g443_i0~~NODE_568_length_1347_cov_192.484592_g443_i0.p1  ORF type:complete len:430 (+),score=95.47 NODE_568_length_1347_cov_192.484592_g443_i0:27-1292(+)
MGGMRDGGFTRPRVLIFVPTRYFATRVVDIITTLLAPETVENADRFQSDFQGDPLERDPKWNRKPEDYRRQFDGNICDRFCFGVSIRRNGTVLRLLSNLYASDFVIASPLGLSEATQKRKNNYHDFLSSIELLIVDQADALMMYDWEKVRRANEKLLNQLPKFVHSTSDFSRIYQTYLAGNMRHQRQTIVISSRLTPELNAFVMRECANRTGLVRATPSYGNGPAMILPELSKIFNGARQVFQRLPCSSTKDACVESRFAYYGSKVFPKLPRDLVPSRPWETPSTVLFVPSYFDFVRLRNFYEKLESECFVELCEYTANKDVYHNLWEFTHMKRSVIMVTERFHFFRRYRIRQAKTVVFYGLPECGPFYSEIVNAVDTARGVTPTVLVLFCRHDAHQLQRVVGTDRAARLLGDEAETHLFS